MANSLLPKTWMDRIPVIFVLIELCLEVTFELCIVFPRLFDTFSLAYIIHFAFGVFCLYNFLGNFYLCMATDLTSGSTILPAVLQPEWHYCPVCLLNQPPRSSHCHTCGKCILKRDHHCMFTGKCIGYNNHRYYMMLLVYFFLGSMFANYLNMDYMYEVIHTLNWKAVMAFITPVIGWMMGLTETLSFLTCFQCSTCILSFVLSIVLIYYHGALIAYGQSTREWRKGIRGYNRGWKQNFLEVFGTRWYLVWLSPWISSPLPGDGIHFLKKINLENVKDM
ncbi:probable palmitoyltransferase ZDHHC24 [Diadema setosum]|uniref:probable palmitoyltransferase ZDHHC24 n=1 Tax=Diadema setosum TaxID=31175 RepID=UPI003B3A2C6D